MECNAVLHEWFRTFQGIVVPSKQWEQNSTSLKT